MCSDDTMKSAQMGGVCCTHIWRYMQYLISKIWRKETSLNTYLVTAGYQNDSKRNRIRWCTHNTYNSGQGPEQRFCVRGNDTFC